MPPIQVRGCSIDGREIAEMSGRDYSASDSGFRAVPVDLCSRILPPNGVRRVGYVDVSARDAQTPRFPGRVAANVLLAALTPG